MTNCINCGAPLSGHKCAYCGTEYAGNQIVADFNRNDCTGTLNIGGNEYRVYLSRMEAESISGGGGRDLMGNFYRDKGRLIHTFTLIEI